MKPQNKTHSPAASEPPATPSAKPAETPSAEEKQLIRTHLRFGWWSLLVFLSAGLGLEVLHGIKAPMYLNVSNEIRRLMWTLSHAHGTLLGLVHIAFAWSVTHASTWTVRSRTLASVSLRGAGILLPAGFFLGGLFIHGGDPGLGILLVPIGGVLLLIAVLLTARAFSNS